MNLWLESLFEEKMGGRPTKVAMVHNSVYSKRRKRFFPVKLATKVPYQIIQEIEI